MRGRVGTSTEKHAENKSTNTVFVIILYLSIRLNCITYRPEADGGASYRTSCMRDIKVLAAHLITALLRVAVFSWPF